MKHRTRVPEYAKANNMSAMQVRNLIHRGIIPAIIIKRLILIDAEEADRALERFKRGGQLGGKKSNRKTLEPVSAK
jgi:adenine specific DNA methylase Mod